MNLSNNGIDCFIVEMPFNLAFLGANSADDIINNDSNDYHNWYISGHSLGGVIASSYAHNNPDKINGLILLSAYPSDDVKNIPVLSIYGSNDEILNKKQYEENIINLSSNFTEYVILGGNHAQFAYYGKQSGDGIANLSREKQINETCNEILRFINKIS